LFVKQAVELFITWNKSHSPSLASSLKQGIVNEMLQKRKWIAGLFI